MINDLPDLCVHRIVCMLCEGRRSCDIVRECVILSATSKATRATYGIGIVDLLNPIRPGVREPVGSVLSSLWSRISAINMKRLPHCGLERRTCVRAQRQLEIVREERDRSARMARYVVLRNALQARGCALLMDSEVSLAFIEGRQTRSLEATVDRAEEMQFLYSKTQYLKILSDMRDADRCRAYRCWATYRTPSPTHVSASDEEIQRRLSSKREAMGRWMKLHANMDTSHVPRTMDRDRGRGHAHT